ncbi:MAG: hypothetical protein GY841_04570 [FCB group bacterium]|nr:hypothetical protein [FCB group bacterium]
MGNKIARYGNKAGRCGSKLSTNCNCIGELACNNICNCNVGRDIDIYFSDIENCIGGGCGDSNCSDAFNQNTFRLTWDAVALQWQYQVGNISVAYFCSGISAYLVAYNSANFFPTGNNCFLSVEIPAPALPATVNNQRGIGDCIVAERCGYNGYAIVSAV